MENKFFEEVMEHYKEIAIDLMVKYPSDYVREYLQGYSQCLWDLDHLSALQYKTLLRHINDLIEGSIE